MSYTANKVAEMVEHANQLQAALTAAAERETKLREDRDSHQRVAIAAQAEVERLKGELAEAQRAAERLEDTNRYQNAEVEDAESALAAERQKVTALVEKLIEMRKHTAKAIEHRHGYPKGDAFGDGLVHGHMNHLSALDALGLTPDPLREK